MSSRAGKNNPRIWIRVTLRTRTGRVDTLVKKRHLFEDRIPLDEDGNMVVADAGGHEIHFTSWEYGNILHFSKKEFRPVGKKNKYGGYSNG